MNIAEAAKLNRSQLAPGKLYCAFVETGDAEFPYQDGALVRPCVDGTLRDADDLGEEVYPQADFFVEQNNARIAAELC
jgi:hypothetical protein